jgi:hypothetical protein
VAESEEVRMANTTKRIVGTVDLTPSWEGLLSGMLAILSDEHSGSAETIKAKRIIREELVQMARGADQYIAAQKAMRISELPKPDAHYTSSTLVAEIVALRKEKSELVGVLREVLPVLNVVPYLESMVTIALAKAEGRA